MRRKAFLALVGVGVLALGAFVLLTRSNSLNLADPAAAQASRSAAKSPTRKHHSSLSQGTASTETGFSSAASGVELAELAEPADPTKAPGGEGVLAAPPSEAPGEARLSGRDQVLHVLDQIDERFQDPEIRAAFARERAKVMANLSE
jgi:hypothetical protein